MASTLLSFLEQVSLGTSHHIIRKFSSYMGRPCAGIIATFTPDVQLTASIPSQLAILTESNGNRDEP